MADVYVKTVEGGETTTATSSHYVELDDGTNSTYISVVNLAVYVWNYLTSLTAKTTLADADQLALADSAASNAGKKITWANVMAQAAAYTQTLTNKTLTSPTINSPTITNLINGLCEARLTLTSGTPVTTSDVTGATNLYITPYRGNRIALYDGTKWTVRNFSEITIALGTLTNALPYDVFVYDNAGTVAARTPVAWTNATTRATALTTQDGVLVKSGATTDRYLGTFYTTSTTTTEDSLAKRLVWNYYNRVRRPMRVVETTNSWTYTTAAFRAMNNSTANALQTVIGWSEDSLTAHVMATCAPSSGNPYRVVGIGVGSTTVNSAQLLGGIITGGKEHTHAYYEAIPAVGYQYYQALEYSEAVGTVTWYGDDGGTIISSGIIGNLFA